MFLDLNNTKNSFIVKNLFVTYTLTENNGVIDLSVVWRLSEISNVISNNFYFYTGIDLGKIQNQQCITSCNGVPKTLDLSSNNRTDSGNSIFLCHWNIPKDVIKDGKKLDEIKLTMEQKNSFDFNNKEVIYFFPWNFEKKIESVTFEIVYPASLGKMKMQFYEVGKVKGEKFPYSHEINQAANEEFFTDTDNNTITYKYHLKNEYLQIENLYYILLQ